MNLAPIISVRQIATIKQVIVRLVCGLPCLCNCNKENVFTGGL